MNELKAICSRLDGTRIFILATIDFETSLNVAPRPKDWISGIIPFK